VLRGGPALHVHQTLSTGEKARAYAVAPHPNGWKCDCGTIRAYRQQRRVRSHIGSGVNNQTSIRRPNRIEGLPSQDLGGRAAGDGYLEQSKPVVSPPASYNPFAVRRPGSCALHFNSLADAVQVRTVGCHQVQPQLAVTSQANRNLAAIG